MSDVIRLLPDSVANQIAAGEVIQRPASVIKELVENAIDAGATEVKIILRDGGKNLIQVIDNGCGMSDTDARMAFERHATSKIKEAADLFSLHTMGFRGEALPSIAAVAQVDLYTRCADSPLGTHLQISASKCESQEPDACAVGTNMAVKNLFFNFPARRKFLKKDSVELTHIVHEFERLALVNPDKEFLLIHNDVILHQLQPASLKQRIVDLFGKNYRNQLIPVATETSLVKISGFVGLPESARKRGALQYFFVNGRNMRHPYFQKAVLNCYENLIPADEQPSFFIDFEVDPQTIDVNIHPTKSEIKFENEVPIWQILVAAVKEALGKFNAVPSIDFESTDAIDLPAFNPNKDYTPESAIDHDYNPFAPGQSSANVDTSALDLGTSATAGSYLPTDSGGWRQSGINSNLQRSALNNWDKLYEGFRRGEPEEIPDNLDISGAEVASTLPGTESTEATNSANELHGKIMLRNRYIVLPSRNGLTVIDAHRAHVKVLFERYIRFCAESAGETQQVLFPESVTLSPSQNVVLESIADDVRTMGFDLSFLGSNTWAINGVPASLQRHNPGELLVKMIEHVAEGADSPDNDLHRAVALSMANAGAIRSDRAMSEAEVESLLSEFLSLSDPTYTPDGRRILFSISLDEITTRLV